MNTEKNENGSDGSNGNVSRVRVAAAAINELDLVSAGGGEQEALDVAQRRSDDLVRLLIKIRRGEGGYDLAKKFLRDNKGLPPET
jgi:hypothetical protein